MRRHTRRVKVSGTPRCHAVRCFTVHAVVHPSGQKPLHMRSTALRHSARRIAQTVTAPRLAMGEEQMAVRTLAAEVTAARVTLVGRMPGTAVTRPAPGCTKRH